MDNENINQVVSTNRKLHLCLPGYVSNEGNTTCLQHIYHLRAVLLTGACQASYSTFTDKELWHFCSDSPTFSCKASLEDLIPVYHLHHEVSISENRKIWCMCLISSEILEWPAITSFALQGYSLGRAFLDATGKVNFVTCWCWMLWCAARRRVWANTESISVFQTDLLSLLAYAAYFSRRPIFVKSCMYENYT